MNDDELNETERGALDTWTPLAPPSGFADRVLAARDAAPARRAKWPLVAGAIAALAAAAAITFVVTRDPSRAASGELAGAEVRTTKALGDRAVAVAEPNATFTWRIDDDGNAVIEQREGDVFYRVDPGGSFVVKTPAGDVTVTGTCFRIEVKPMNRTKQLVVTGTLGAAVAAAAVITVYEGHVIADSKQGGRTEVVAGNRATLEPGGTTSVAAAGAPGSDPWVLLDEKNATREQLIARASYQQKELAKLREKIKQLENPAAGREPEEGRPFFDPSPERLQAWVAECRVSADIPSLDRWEPMKTLGKNPRGLEPSELSAYNAVMSEMQKEWKALIRALYIEATGDTQGVDNLSLDAMRGEIEEKGDDTQHNTMLQRIAMERAGLAQPPADLSKLSPYERMFRAQLDLGGKTEQALAKRLGPDRARAIRGDSWDSRSIWSGCPDDGSD